MRAKIKSLALDLLVQNGYRGMSFGDLAEEIGTTRANIHHHFGNKQNLVEEVVVDYIRETNSVVSSIWLDPDVALVDKINKNLEFNVKRYSRYNRRGREGRPWSLITRMRQDSQLLTPRCHDALDEFATHLLACMTEAVKIAIRRKEFAANLPVDDVALQLFSIANTSPLITQDSGNFERLRELYVGFARIITHAFGKNRKSPPKRRAASNTASRASTTLGATSEK